MDEEHVYRANEADASVAALETSIFENGFYFSMYVTGR